MASCKTGHVYIVDTTLTKPPKQKYALCVCEQNNYFVWFNSDPRKHGHDQLAVSQGCHALIKKDCFIDLSQIVVHQPFEMADAKEFDCIDGGLIALILEAIDEGLFLLPAAHAEIIRTNLASKLP